MKRFDHTYKDLGNLMLRVVNPFIDLNKLAHSIPGYIKYLSDKGEYERLPDAEPMSLSDAHPCVFDAFASHPIDSHYLYQGAWALKRILDSEREWHVDVGSRLDFVTLMSASLRVEFVDIRKLNLGLDGLGVVQGNILQLPFASNSVISLSCLHVAEHIGLGRYGDPLGPNGTKDACIELARVLAPGSHLYFSLPVGRPRLCFNAHRIHSPDQILNYFRDLELVKFSLVTDAGTFVPDAELSEASRSDYACGLFDFRKAL